MITKMTILRAESASKEFNPYLNLDLKKQMHSVCHEAEQLAEHYTKTSRLFNYLTAKPSANIAKAFKYIFGIDPVITARTKKIRTYRIYLTVITEEDPE